MKIDPCLCRIAQGTAGRTLGDLVFRGFTEGFPLPGKRAGRARPGGRRYRRKPDIDLDPGGPAGPGENDQRMYCGVTFGGHWPMHRMPCEYAFETSAERFGDLNCRSIAPTWYSIPCLLR